MTTLINTNELNTITMSSLEIAELTGKRHDHVVRDIRVMLKELELDIPKFGDTYKDTANRNQKMFKLDKELTMTLITGYSIKLRHTVIKRLDELEQAIDAIASSETHEEALSIAQIAQEQRRMLRVGHKEDSKRISKAVAEGTLSAGGREHNFIHTRVSMFLFGCAPCVFSRKTGLDVRDYFESIGDIESLAMIAKTLENIVTLSEVGFTKDQLMQKFPTNPEKYFK